MKLDIASIEIEPKRHTFGHIAERFGEDRPASRYEEAVYDAQATENFHYKPQWEPEFEIYDVKRTAIVMSDWYKLLDPRKFHYMTYVSSRAKKNDANTQNFIFFEKRGMLSRISNDARSKIYDYITPLRHYEYGANLNNLTMVVRGYGTAFTSACLFHASDRLGMAQHITKTILAVSNNDTSKLDDGKNNWLNDSKWQGLRKAVEDTLVIKDPIKLFVAQNVVLDAFVIPVLISKFSETMVDIGFSEVAMMNEFVTTWYEESAKWVNSVIKVIAEESAENKQTLESWVKEYINIAEGAITPLAGYANNSQEIVSNAKGDLVERLNKNGLSI